MLQNSGTQTIDKRFPNEYHRYGNPSHFCSSCVIGAARKTDSISQFQFQWQCYFSGCGFLKHLFSTEASKKYQLHSCCMMNQHTQLVT